MHSHAGLEGRLSRSESAFWGRSRTSMRFFDRVGCCCLPVEDRIVRARCIEAGLAQRPILASRIGGFRPDSIVDGRTGPYIAPEDPVALADAIARVHGDRQWARSLAKAAQEHAAEQFGHEVLAIPPGQGIDAIDGRVDPRTVTVPLVALDLSALGLGRTGIERYAGLLAAELVTRPDIAVRLYRPRSVTTKSRQAAWEVLVRPALLARDRPELCHVPTFSISLFRQPRVVATIHDVTQLSMCTGKLRYQDSAVLRDGPCGR